MEWFLRIWLPIALAVTGTMAVQYAVVQQVYRQSLNDPQIQIAEEAAYGLDNGAKPFSLVPTTTRMIDVAQSLRPYIVIYDKDLKPLAWNAQLDGKPPMPPKGVFETAKSNPDASGENRVSWEPREGVRSAIVVVHVLKTDGYVLSGRNMRETEARIWHMEAIIGIAWVAILLVTLVSTWIGARIAAGKTGVVW